MRSNNRFLFNEDDSSEDSMTVMGVFLKKEDAIRIEMQVAGETTWVAQTYDPASGDLIETTGDFRLEAVADLVRERVFDCDTNEDLDDLTSDDEVARAFIEAACGVAGIDFDPEAEIVVMTSGNPNPRRVSGPTSPKKLGWKRVVN